MEALVELRGGEASQRFRCASGERLLYAGLRSGARVSYGCATGTCGSCKARVVEGSVEPLWPDAPGRRALRKPGEILLCQTAPLGDCVLEARPPACTYSRELPSSTPAVVQSVDRDGDGLAWIVLKLDTAMRFYAGQFVLVALEGIEGFRAYSPAHDGSEVTELSLVVREKAGGGVSPFLCSPAAEGARATVFGPLGTAHVHPAEDGDMALLVGGSGAGVALSVIDWASSSGHLSRHRVDVVCGLRTTQSRNVIDRLAAYSEKHAQSLQVVVALSEGDELPPARCGLRFARGLAHEAALELLAPEEWKRRAVFVAGPAPMVEASLRMLLMRVRMNPAGIRYDSFA